MSLQNWMLVILVAVILVGAYLRYCGTQLDVGRLLVLLVGIVLAAVVLSNAGWINQTVHTASDAISHPAAQPGQAQDPHTSPAHRP